MESMEYWNRQHNKNQLHLYVIFCAGQWKKSLAKTNSSTHNTGILSLSQGLKVVALTKL